MTDKFIPPGEIEFAQKARSFARMIGREPQRFGVSRQDGDALVHAVEAYLARYEEASNRYRCSPYIRDLKKKARNDAKRLIEKIGRMIRISEQVSGPDKSLLGIYERPARLKKSECP